MAISCPAPEWREADAGAKTGFPTLKMGENLNKRMTSTGYRLRFAGEAKFAERVT